MAGMTAVVGVVAAASRVRLWRHFVPPIALDAVVLMRAPLSSAADQGGGAYSGLGVDGGLMDRCTTTGGREGVGWCAKERSARVCVFRPLHQRGHVPRRMGKGKS